MLPVSEDIPYHGDAPHDGLRQYCGDCVRILYVLAAVLLFAIQFTGIDLPFTVFGAILMMLILVLAAGFTNPVLGWMQWVNLFIALFGTLLFGTLSLAGLRAGAPVFPDGFLIGALTIVFLISLYFAGRTLRGYLMRGTPEIE